MEENRREEALMSEFDYSQLTEDTREFLKGKELAIKARTSQTVWENGRDLMEAKDRLEHGQFTPWCRANFPWSKTTIADMINVAKRLPNFRQAELSSKALYMLAAPSTPESAREEALQRAGGGETLSTQEARDIIQEHKVRPLIPELMALLDSDQISRKSAEHLAQMDEAGQAFMAAQYRDNIEMFRLKDRELKQLKDEYGARDYKGELEKLEKEFGTLIHEKMAADRELEQVNRNHEHDRTRIAALQEKLQEKLRSHKAVEEKVIEVVPHDYEDAKRHAKERQATIKELLGKLEAQEAEAYDQSRELQRKNEWGKAYFNIHMADVVVHNALSEIGFQGTDTPADPPESMFRQIESIRTNLKKFEERVHGTVMQHVDDPI